MKDTPDSDEAPLLTLLGLKPNFLPAEDSPPVDEGRIEKFLGGRLAQCEALEVEFAIRSFEEWYWAWSRAVARRACSPGGVKE